MSLAVLLRGANLQAGLGIWPEGRPATLGCSPVAPPYSGGQDCPAPLTEEGLCFCSSF